MNISTLQSNLDFIKSLYFHEEWKDKHCKKEILKAIEECNEKIEKAFGLSMHKLDRYKSSFEAVEKVANKFPSTLAYENHGRIPIQFAATSNGYEYVPILAKEGMKHKVGGEDARGGLLKVDPKENRGWNVLQFFVRIGISTDAHDAKRVNVLKELRRSGLLLKKDIQEYNLLQYSCYEPTKERFEYLANWDPDALTESRYHNKPLIHAMANFEVSLHLLLKAGFKYHPNIGGLLFIEDDNGIIAFDAICNEIGEEKTMEILHDILSPTREFPILHHVFIKTPQHQKLFTDKFPWAYHLKDHNGRTLHQAVLAAGAKVMNECGFLFASLSDNQIQEKDPISTLHPFAAMAVGEHADLEKCYYLLRRQPSVLEKRSRIENIRKRKKRRIELSANGDGQAKRKKTKKKNQIANHTNEDVSQER
ncbi:hypothetical protein CTEN210_06383 [Chaetoceros tenuissimus]|uniref:Uncharacterized protein n=1 Tax=Chaetoceros tenuissimus TaxID=426638 RepID=A0AAD3H446_9STRA|nr:hypothetical protein CTEN210_06383 [Chaetoceros tenuissimus]